MSESTKNQARATDASAFKCGTCCTRAGQPHVPGCPETGLASAVRMAIEILAQVDTSKVPLAVPAAIGVLRTALPEHDATSVPSARSVIVTLLAVATAAWHALDNSEELPDGAHRITSTDAAALGASLDVLDELPDDRPGYKLHGPGRAEWALRALLEYPKTIGADFFSAQLGTPWAFCKGSQVHPDSALPSQRGHSAAQPGAEWDERNAAVRDVLAERRRQVEQEGYEPDHDDEHKNEEIAAYAAYFAMPPGVREWPATETGYADTFGEAIVPDGWTPKPQDDRRRELVKAGALILAEIERIDRAAAASGRTKGGAA